MSKVEINKDIRLQAREWSVRLSGDDVDKQVLDEFEKWRSADPLNEIAFQRVDCLMRGSAELTELRQYAKLPAAFSREEPVASAEVPESGFWQKLAEGIELFFASLTQPSGIAMGSAFALVLAVGLFYVMPADEQGAEQLARANYSTEHGETKSITLEDRSVITLGPESQLRVALGENQRALRLTSGSALFEVSKDPQRPFTVLTGGTETRVLGTTFTVRHKPYGVRIAVKEGKVRVGKPLASEAKDLGPNVLTAGQGVTASLNAEVSQRFAVDTKHVGAWTNGQLVYDEASLKEIVDDANRYYDGLILLADKRTGEQRLSIAFDSNSIEEMIDNISAILDLDVNRDSPKRVILKLK